MLSFSACKNSGTTEQSNSSEVDSTLPADFNVFYQKFHKDSLYQLDHISFPLEGYPAHASSNLEEGQEFRWQKEDWVMHKPFNNENGEYDLSFQSFGEDIIVETILHEPSNYQMQRRFMKSSDGWRLMYYMAMNKVTE